MAQQTNRKTVLITTGNLYKIIAFDSLIWIYFLLSHSFPYFMIKTNPPFHLSLLSYKDCKELLKLLYTLNKYFTKLKKRYTIHSVATQKMKNSFQR